jgi:hypothetical protein
VREKGSKMIVQDVLNVIENMPKSAEIDGIFVTRRGNMDENRMQEFIVKITASTSEGARHTCQFSYGAYIKEDYPRKKQVVDAPCVEEPLKQNPFAGIKGLFS